MGVARLLAKAWVVLCLFAGGHALYQAVFQGGEALDAFIRIAPPVVLFLAMGLLFVGGYGASTHGFFANLKLNQLVPHFTDIVFALFAALSFANQTTFAPHNAAGPLADQIENAIAWFVPGQRAFVAALEPCSLDGGRIFASAVAWILGFVLFGSSLSRLRLAAGLFRLERTRYPHVLSAGVAALVLGVVSVIGIQLLLVGTVFLYIPCDAFTTVPGQVLIGLGPILLAYVIIAALTALMAAGEE